MSVSTDHARKATISWDAWCHKMRDQATFNYKQTEWYRAGLALEQEAKEPPPLPAMHPPGARCVYFSEVTDDAIVQMGTMGAGYTALFSADLNLSVEDKPYHVSDVQLDHLRERGVVVASWCDCAETPYSAAWTMAKERHLAFAGGQAENNDQYLRATLGGATHLIGNPANLTGDVLQDAIRRSYAGTLAFIGEVIQPDSTYSAQGVNITSACFYIDRDKAQGGYIPLLAYAAMGSLRNGCSLYTGGRAARQDWDTYHGWTHP